MNVPLLQGVHNIQIIDWGDTSLIGNRFMGEHAGSTWLDGCWQVDSLD